MGKKDNPQRSNWYLLIIVALVISGLLTSLRVANHIDALKVEVEISKEQLEEQGSLIDQREEEIRILRDEGIHLKDSLQKYQEEIKQKSELINKLEEELLSKAKRAKAVATSSSLSSRSYQPKRTLTMEATAYTAFCDTGCIGITRQGTNVKNTIYHPSGHRIIAVDPRVIPLGSVVKIEGLEGTFIADDTGGAIKGHIIDILVPNTDIAFSWGRRTVKVTIMK